MSRIRFGSAIGRREFLRHAGLATAAALVSPETLLADPYAPLPRILRPAAPVRVRGRVVSRGRGVRNVSVTDGLSVVRTDADGRYELVTTTRQRFVYLPVPSGYRIPVNETGTARFYQPIQPDRRGEMNAISSSSRSRPRARTTPSSCWPIRRRRTPTRWSSCTVRPCRISRA